MPLFFLVLLPFTESRLKGFLLKAEEEDTFLISPG